MADDKDGFFNCANTCWIIGAVVGLVVFLLLRGLVGMNWVIALLIGVAVLVGAAMLLKQKYCETIGAETGSPAKAAPPKTPEPAPRAETGAAPKPAPKTEPKPKPAAKPAETAAAATSTEPETLTAPRDGQPDDLKKISGVGPKLERTLNELGFYHYDQIANWTPEQVAWVDSRLTFKGRIERDNWIDQARSLDRAK